MRHPQLPHDVAVIRPGTHIDEEVAYGHHFETGHNVLIRGPAVFGKHVMIGTGSVLEGETTFGDYVKVQSLCYVCSGVRLGSRVFLGPGVKFLNDRYPLRGRDRYQPLAPSVEDGVTIGAGAIIMPGVSIGAGAFVAAGAIVTRGVPPNTMAIGQPAIRRPLSIYADFMTDDNDAPDWALPNEEP